MRTSTGRPPRALLGSGSMSSTRPNFAKQGLASSSGQDVESFVARTFYSSKQPNARLALNPATMDSSTGSTPANSPPTTPAFYSGYSQELNRESNRFFRF